MPCLTPDFKKVHGSTVNLLDDQGHMSCESEERDDQPDLVPKIFFLLCRRSLLSFLMYETRIYYRPERGKIALKNEITIAASEMHGIYENNNYPQPSIQP